MRSSCLKSKPQLFESQSQWFHNRTSRTTNGSSGSIPGWTAEKHTIGKSLFQPTKLVNPFNEKKGHEKCTDCDSLSMNPFVRRGRHITRHFWIGGILEFSSPNNYNTILSATSQHNLAEIGSKKIIDRWTNESNKTKSKDFECRNTNDYHRHHNPTMV